eukprot:4891827-Pleurochrysis_carterae.AAC.2
MLEACQRRTARITPWRAGLLLSGLYMPVGARLHPRSCTKTCAYSVMHAQNKSPSSHAATRRGQQTRT